MRNLSGVGHNPLKHDGVANGAEREPRWILGLWLLSLAACADGYSTTPQYAIVAPPYDAGSAGAGGDGCVLGQKVTCMCPDGISSGLKVCAKDPAMPSDHVFSVCMPCLPLPAAGSGGMSVAAAGQTAYVAGVSGGAAGARAAGSGGASGRASPPPPPPPNGGSSATAGRASGGNGGGGSASVAGSSGTVAGTSGAAAGSGGRGAAGTPGGNGGSSAACNCSRNCLLNSEPCCRDDGSCGCTSILTDRCL